MVASHEPAMAPMMSSAFYLFALCCALLGKVAAQCNTWTDCASEADLWNPPLPRTCTCTGYVRFGIGSTWLTLSQPISATIICTIASSGGYSGFTYDPIPNVSKKCQCSTPCATSCAAGTYSASGSTACTNCVAGAYSTGTGLTTCASCSAGSFSTASGASAPAACVACVAGTYSTASGASISAACVSCAAGTYSTGTGLTTCAQCGAGTYSTAVGATAAAACSICGAGSFLTGAGMEFCSLDSNQPVALDARGDSMGGSAMYNWGRGPDGSRPYSAPSIQPLSHRSQTGHNPV